MDQPGYEQVECQLNLKGCEKTHAGYSRRKQFATIGPWLDACETCARQPYSESQGEKDEKQP